MKHSSKGPYVLALDCGTTGNRAIVFDSHQRIRATSYREFTQYYPRPGWVEHDPEEIWRTVLRVARQALSQVATSRVQGIGITNQRETVVLWNKKTGKPVCPAVVWQDRRTGSVCEALKKKGLEKKVHEKTGLFLDPYFSATKIQWLLHHHKQIKKGLHNGTILCGTIDTWIIWKLSGGRCFSTDPTNASRTLLYNIKRHAWDDSLLKLFDVPRKALAEVRPSSGFHGMTLKKWFGKEIPIAGVAGDQQAAAFAQGCSPQGIVKNTYGTGLFVVADTGRHLKISERLVTTVAACEGTETRYALEGSIFIGGAAIQWLRDGLKILKNASFSEKMARSLDSNDHVYFVPGLAGLGCPHWDPKARGTLVGLTRQTRREHLVRAALEAMAYQTRDVLDLVKKEMRFPVKRLRVDGGAVKNDFLMQFQADILGCEVERPVVHETTALGAAALAGLATGVWQSQKDFLKKRKIDKIFKPRMKPKMREAYYADWKRAVARSLDWIHA